MGWPNISALDHQRFELNDWDQTGAYIRLGLLWEVGDRARLDDDDQAMVSLGWAF